MVNKEDLVINTIHNKVNKEDIYFLGIMRKLLKDVDFYMFQNKYTHSGRDGFGMFILKKEEVPLFKESKLSHIFLNYHKNIQGNENGKLLEYKISDEYTLLIYCSLKVRSEVIINMIMKNNMKTLQLLFTNENLKVFQQKILDVFGLYGCATIIQMLFYYINVLGSATIFSRGVVKKNLGRYGEGDITIDISILEKIVKEGKEKFQDKLDLLYLLFSNINKRKIPYINFDHFYCLPELCISNLKALNDNIDQDVDGEFKTYFLKVEYLCGYIFKEFFEDHVYGGPKDLFAFYDFSTLGHFEPQYHKLVGKKVHVSYKNFDVKELKRLLLLVDQKLYKLYK